MTKLSTGELHTFLEQAVEKYQQAFFIEEDPISIPHLFDKKEDIEIAGFLTAILAWGQRPVILRNCKWLVEQMDMAPHAFVLDHSSADRKAFAGFVHRTFKGVDMTYFLKALQLLYREYGGLETAFATCYKEQADMASAISGFRTLFLSFKSPARTAKHIGDPLKNAAAKRFCMYLRWMVRSKKSGVDFGIWKTIKPSALYTPLDLHSGRVARSLGLLMRQQDDWKAVEELTERLRTFDAADPVKYDFALFGLGAYENFK